MLRSVQFSMETNLTCFHKLCLPGLKNKSKHQELFSLEMMTSLGKYLQVIDDHRNHQQRISEGSFGAFKFNLEVCHLFKHHQNL